MSEPGRPLRLFVAIPLPEPLREELAGLSRALREGCEARISWVRAENLHLTLRFLGDQPGEQVDAIAEAAARALASLPPLTAQVHGGGQFPERGRPRVLWAGVRGAGPPLAWALDQGLAPLELGERDHPFRPHLTLGRVRAGDARPLARSLAELGYLGSFIIDHACLYLSEPGSSGPRYTTLARLPLLGSSA